MLHFNSSGSLPAQFRGFFRSSPLFRLLPAAVCASALADAPLQLVGTAGALPVIVDAEAPAATHAAARDLVRILKQITGQRPELHAGVPDPLPARAIWVGMQPALEAALPDTDLSLTEPEEILIVNDSRHLAILGRDRVGDGQQTEFGTANAVYTFLHRHLDVRWLWPGELGTDIPQGDTLTLPPLSDRFHPPIRNRTLYFPRARTDPAIIAWWDVYQRRRGSLDCSIGHAFDDWWDRFGADHPEYFALQPEGTRKPPGRPHSAKLCVSNPRVADQWLADAEQTLRAQPHRQTLSASPTDGGGWCVCESCNAWDHPDAGVDRWTGHPVLTERYVRFWNRLARGLKERFPERELLLDVMAYSRYRMPPLATTLEDNIAVAYVGHFPIIGEAMRQEQKQILQAWAGMAHQVKYRPNLFIYSGGVWGLPAVALRKTTEDFRFLAENRVVSIAIDAPMMNFATMAPQNYLIAQLSYDPLQDGHALLADFYGRGFGAAATDIERYFALMEAAHQQIVESDGFLAGMGGRIRVLETIKSIFDDDLFDRADRMLRRAEAAVSDSPPIHRQRVAFVRTGLTFTRLQVQIMHAMDKVRASHGRDVEALATAVALCDQRQQLFDTAELAALDGRRMLHHIQMRRMEDYLGPPSEAFLEAGKGAQADEPPGTRLAVADAWRLVFEDDFNRETLGDAWEAVSGVWELEAGCLVSRTTDAVLLSRGAYPELQRIEFEIEAPTPATLPFVSDLSPLLHVGHDDNLLHGGYFLQFGGMRNTQNTVMRLGRAVRENTDARIRPDTPHHVVAEFDGVHVRLVVDDTVVLEYDEPEPLIGPEHARLGLYAFTGAKIHRVRIYQATPRAAHPELDNPDFD